MTDKLIESNSVKLAGEVVSELEFSHQMYGEGFYMFKMEIPRLSNFSDELPITISERLLGDMNLKKGAKIFVEGQLRSYNRYINGNNKLLLTIFARDAYSPQEEDFISMLKKPNEIYLDGYICKKPVYRTTPFGREITDILLAVNRPYNKSDYIPCISWGRNARFCEKLKIGDHIKLWGRIQSRTYQKKLNNTEISTRIAYEVSVSKLEFIKDDNNRELKKEEADALT
ncbi:single-stranded DNA-binding protein [Abyssisolibacter fermentans]|uniref:single-stranded DNA-binding protein n=1 Tax=Abyssisolibacter fermentans TaxID=1766203 RepID=UPI00082A4A4F|nr:single-stranded DNA-binding protein [Abyssisolibacter fermentans]